MQNKGGKLMFYYERTLQVTETEFNSCQEDIKNAVRQIVDRYKTKYLEVYSSLKVKFLVSMKGEEIPEKYKFQYLHILKNNTEEIVGELAVHIKVVKEESN